ncbi:uncharacterized protein LOC124788361 [Schistocerca piceifrons]|uniref:uncharacterized protein LOC124788361 n=1 Tax=Schistocerca piceifrons TaxID=274613 RepID=UPI001F5EE5B3|nr:uncharacterized protein LOC124788361 [Schistocerca piceifrons]
MAAPRAALLVLAAVLLCAVVAAPSGTKLTKEQLRAMFMKNLRRFRSFPCREPQRRSVMVGDLLLRKGELSPSQTIAPPATVLHLCGPSTGCCYSSDTVCAPLENQTVTLPFRVQDTLQGSDFSDMSINFVNHTRCGCVSRTEARDTEEVVWETNSVA